MEKRTKQLKFEPFGYRFEVSSKMTPADAKATIRSRKSGIFDPKNGARGWIAGPFICLWFSAFDRHGPILFGLISTGDFGTRIHGKAGSDLNGVLMFTLMIPLMAWLVVMMISDGQASGRQLLVIALVFLVGGPLLYWSAHNERKDAEPLVRFLRKTLTPSATRSKSSVRSPEIRKGLRVILNGDYLEGPVTQEVIDSAFMRVGSGDFMVIESGPQDYMQTACSNGRYILEVRKGGPDAHYRAVRNEPASIDCPKSDDTFIYEEVNAAMDSHVSGAPLPDFLRLEPIDATS
ncbi:hypothetical protein [Sphingopyxis panaciterrae]